MRLYRVVRRPVFEIGTSIIYVQPPGAECGKAVPSDCGIADQG